MNMLLYGFQPMATKIVPQEKNSFINIYEGLSTNQSTKKDEDIDPVILTGLVACMFGVVRYAVISEQYAPFQLVMALAMLFS